MEQTQQTFPELKQFALGIDADDIFGDGEVLTPPIEAMVGSIVEWIHTGLPGNSVYGPRRAGKSFALKYMVSTLSDALGYPVLCVTWVFPDEEIKPRHFLQIALEASGCEQIVHRDTEVLVKRMIASLADRMAMAHARRVIILVDEGQVLSMANFMQMGYLYNRFEKANLRPYFVTTGQPELLGIRQNWEAAKAHHITGRFFVQEHAFQCVAQADFETVFDCFDEPIVKDGPSPLAAVLPQAYASGWRLRNAAPAFRTALAATANVHKVQQEIPMPMSYLRMSLVALVRRMAAFPFRPDMVSEAMVLNCFNTCNFPRQMFEYVPVKLPLAA